MFGDEVRMVARYRVQKYHAERGSGTTAETG